MSDEQVLSYPLPYEAALEPAAKVAELRGQCPVASIRLPDGREAKLLTRYDDVRTLMSDPRFTRVPPRSGMGQAEDGTALPMHGEGHLQWRRLVGRWFTAKRMTALRPRIREIGDRLIDEMVAGGAPADLKASFGFPLPVYVICEMLGVPADDRGQFSHWSDVMLNLNRYTDEEMAAARREFVAYMSGLIQAKHAEPADDLLSELIRTQDGDGPTLTDPQLVMTGMGLLVAGHETTANMIGKMVAMLLADHSRWERLVADRSLVRTAVDEALRYDANIGLGLSRLITEDIEVAGEPVPSGTTVLCDMAAANRDERAYGDPNDMDLARTPNPHLTFGVGAHSCLGQSLARTELQVVLETLLDRLPSLELAVSPDELRRTEGLLPGGLTEVPVRW